jgi:hypothetical protein
MTKQTLTNTPIYEQIEHPKKTMRQTNAAKLTLKSILSGISFCLLSLIGTTASSQTVVQWPSTSVSPSCDGSAHGTLQHCLNSLVTSFSAAGGLGTISVQIVGSPENPNRRSIDYDVAVTLPQQISLILSAAPLVDVVFTQDHSLHITDQGNIPAATNSFISIDGFNFTRGRLSISHQRTGLGSIDYGITNVNINSIPIGECGISFETYTDASEANFIAAKNKVRSTLNESLGSNRGICVSGSQNSALNLRIGYNQIESDSGGFIAGIDLSNSPGSANPDYLNIQGNIYLFSNQIFGGNRIGNGIRFLHMPTANPISINVSNNVLTGWSSRGNMASNPAFESSIKLVVYEGDTIVTNNTVVSGGNGIHISHSAIGTNAEPVHTLVLNNLITHQTYQGLSVENRPMDRVSGAKNLLFRNGTNSFPTALITETITSDPLLYSLRYPRPLRASPAVDNAVTLPIEIDLTRFDADGELRYVSRFGHSYPNFLDIGAYEYNGDQAMQLTASSNNASGHTIDVDALDALSVSSNLVATPQLMGRVSEAHNRAILGVYNLSNPPGPNFGLYFEDQRTPIPQGQRFNVISTTDYPSKLNAYCISAQDMTYLFASQTCGNILSSAHYTPVFAVGVVTHRFDPPAGGSPAPSAYNQLIGLSYFSSSWYIGNESPLALNMPNNLIFNIVAGHQSSPNAFSVLAPGTGSVSHRQAIPLKHSLLDNNPCAAPVVGYSYIDSETPRAVQTAATPFALEYRDGSEGAPGHWYAVATEASSFPMFGIYQRFNIILDGAQANRCRIHSTNDSLFKNSFED